MNQSKNCPTCRQSELSPLHAVICTPTPLDPSKVKAGDTVTLTRGKRVVTDVVIRVSAPPSGSYTEIQLEGDASAVHVWSHPEAFNVAKPYTVLTDHQPAPEPESEWKPGTVALVRFPGGEDDRPNLPASYAQIDGPDGEWRSLNGECADYASDVEVIRPLVVIDPAAVDVLAIAKAMHQVDYPGLDFALNLDQSVYVAKARAALADLGIRTNQE